ncbi:MAG: hypothetical protein LRY55_01150 [Leadbetterella sp.]|nr:hypothetical protein [Leadbetterella sp.]
MSRDKMTFEFFSEGRETRILKIVEYQNMGLRNLYNLALGDKNLLTGEIDDKVSSNNGDRDKVLVTVAATIYTFTNQYPETRVYITGSTDTRTRLYRMGISRFLDEITRDFVVLGEMSNKWKIFKINTTYTAFLVIRKSKFSKL